MTSSTDFLNMQINLKHNQAELSDFMSDLDSWQQQIKEKDEAIKSISSPEDASANQIAPPVRNVATKPKKPPIQKAKIESKSTETEKPSKIKSYDYRAWDKFDVDQACEQIETKSDNSVNRVEDDEDDDEEERVKELLKQREKQKASFYKEQGNKCLKNGKLNDAIIYYTNGIEADPSNALLYSNRAMANLKLSKFQLAADDSTEAIRLDPYYFKSYLRRASAYSSLGRIEESEKDLTRVLSLQPDNKEAKAELNKLKLVKENKSGIANANNVVLPVKKPVGKRSKVPLKRIHIEEVSNVHLSPNLGAQADFIKPKTEKPRIVEIEEKVPNREESTSNEVVITEVPEQPEPDSVLQSGIRVEKKTEHSTQEMQMKVPMKPESSMQFIRDLKSLQKREDLFYDYLIQVDPTELPKLIPHSAFDANTLNLFLAVFKQYFVSKKEMQLFPFLHSLTKIKRFSTVAMFLSASEKQTVSELLAFCENCEGIDSFHLSSVKKAFSI